MAVNNYKKEQRVCVNCKTPFTTYKKIVKKYCSFKCVYSDPEWRAKQRKQTHSVLTRELIGAQSSSRNKGAGNGRFTHGLNTLRRIVLENANSHCQVCNESVGAVKGFLDIHHINMNHHDNAITNLIAVCPNCHRKAHLKEKQVL